MIVEVYWTQEAERTFNSNIDYLSNIWDSQTIYNFLKRVDEAVETPKKSPYLYPIYNKSSRVHKCIVNKHIVLYYKRVGKTRIDLLTFWNTHQNPENIRL
jgi:hypothetical protein